MSILDPSTCGFAEIALFNIFLEKQDKRNTSESLKNYKGRVFSNQLCKFKEYFAHSENFTIEYKKFTDNFPKIVPIIKNLAKTKSDKTKKEDVLKTFSKENWKKSEKEKHSLFQCKGCLSDHELQSGLSKFPVKSKLLKKKAKELGLIDKEVLSDITNNIIETLDTDFKKDFGVSFTHQIKQKFKKNAVDKVKEKQAVGKEIKLNVEKQWKETSVERCVYLELLFTISKLI